MADTPSSSWISRRYPALLHRDFRLLWLAQVISITGSQMQNVAVGWQVFEMTGSKAALGLIGLSRALPIIALALIGGAVADARSRRTIMVVTQSTMMLTALALAILAGSGLLVSMTTTIADLSASSIGATLGNPDVDLALEGTTWTLPVFLVIGLTALASAAGAFDGPARQSLIPNLVPPEHLSSAVSLGTMAFQVAMVAGPALSGFVIAAWGTAGVYLINALTFVAVIVALLVMRHVEQRNADERSTVSVAAVMESLRYLRRAPLIYSTMLLDFFATFFATASALLPAYAKEVLRTDARGLGILYSAESIGSLVAGLIVVSIGEMRKQGRVILIAVACYGAATALFGLSETFPLAFLMLALVGAGDAVSTVIRQTIRQVATPDALRGRINAANMIFFMGGPQLGNFEAGIVAAALGTPASIVIGGVAVVGVVAIMAWRFPILRRYDRWEGGEAKVGGER